MNLIEKFTRMFTDGTTRWEEGQIAEAVADLYRRRETIILVSAGDARQRAGRLGTTVDSLTMNRANDETAQVITGIVDAIYEVGVQALLESVPDPNRRSAILASGLRAAQGVWEERVQLPDLPPELMILGERRLTQIQSRSK